MITPRPPIMGNGRGKKPLFPGLQSPAIAHNELVANARFVAFDVPERDFPGYRSPARWKFVCRPKRKICAPGEVARLQRRPRRSPLLFEATALQARRTSPIEGARKLQKACICVSTKARKAAWRDLLSVIGRQSALGEAGIRQLRRDRGVGDEAPLARPAPACGHQDQTGCG